jgi:hypothetical protein
MSAFKSINPPKKTQAIAVQPNLREKAPQIDLTAEIDEDKNEVLARVLYNNSTHTVFVGNPVVGITRTTQSLAQAAIIMGKTTGQSDPVEWEKTLEDMGPTIFTQSLTMRFFDVETTLMTIEKQELIILLPLTQKIENRRIILSGMGNESSGREAAERIRECYKPSTFDMIFHPLDVEWCEFFLLIEISEEEIANSFPGLCDTKNWARYKKKMEYQIKREDKKNAV